MDASEYKHVVLGLIFLKYISDKFETRFNELIEKGEGFEENRDEFAAENIFWVPKEARWSFIMDSAKDLKIGHYVDEAIILVEIIELYQGRVYDITLTKIVQFVVELQPNFQSGPLI